MDVLGGFTHATAAERSSGSVLYYASVFFFWLFAIWCG
jgi:hypothetical protein